MILVKNEKTNEVREYYSLEDFVEDKCTNEMVMEWITDYIGSIDFGGDQILPAGELLYAYLKIFPEQSRYYWNDYIDGFISIEAERIREELMDNEELIYFGDTEYSISGDEE